MIRKFGFALILFITIWSNTLFAQRKYVNEFLNIGVGARALGLGGAVVATTNDVTSGYWNPSGLRKMPSDFQLSVMHNDYLGGLAKYDYIGLAYRLAKNKGNLGINVIRFAVDDIPYTINLLNPDGSVDYNALTKTLSVADYAALIGFSKDLKLKRFAERDDIYISIGANAKIIHRQIGSIAKAWGVGADIGIKAQVRRWYFGAVLRDATTTYTGWTFSLNEREKTIFSITQNDIPVQSGEVMTPRLTLGFARFIPTGNKLSFMPELNVDLTTDGSRYGAPINLGQLSISGRAGMEMNYNKKYFLRLGVNNFQTVKDNTDSTYEATTLKYQPSLGVGFYVNNVTIDYAFTSLNLQQNPLYSHVFSLKFDLRKPKKFRLSSKKEKSKKQENK